ncbi:hypothetical protein EDD11_008403 [Mortierella claussenii]|nr:hypothetical protein EDD11_008403 [Mortierella claussenii]
MDDFLIRNTRLDEVDTFIEILEETAVWLKANNIIQWPPGMFRNPESRLQLLDAIAAHQCFMIVDRCSPGDDLDKECHEQIAGLFVLNYEDRFDEILWKDSVDDWKDALYLHRLVLKKPYQGMGLTPRIIEFAVRKVKEAGRHFLRLDCLMGNTSLRRFYRERCQGQNKGGMRELSAVWNSDLQLEFARFELPV